MKKICQDLKNLKTQIESKIMIYPDYTLYIIGGLVVLQIITLIFLF